MLDWLFSKKPRRITPEAVMQLPNVSIQITQQGQVKHATFSRQANILSALEQAQLPVRHSCRSGNCGACLASLAQGEVAYLRDISYPLEAAEVLMCACVPLSDVQLHIPDVLPHRQRRS